MNYQTSNSFIMYRTHYKTYKRLAKRDPELAKRFIEAIFDYAFDGILPDEDDPVMIYAEGPIDQIGNSLRNYRRKLGQDEEDY